MSQSFDIFDLGVQNLVNQKNAILNELNSLYAELKKYQSVKISPVNLSGMTQLNSSIERQKAIIGTLNSEYAKLINHIADFNALSSQMKTMTAAMNAEARKLEAQAKLLTAETKANTEARKANAKAAQESAYADENEAVRKKLVAMSMQQAEAVNREIQQAEKAYYAEEKARNKQKQIDDAELAASEKKFASERKAELEAEMALNKQVFYSRAQAIRQQQKDDKKAQEETERLANVYGLLKQEIKQLEIEYVRLIQLKGIDAEETLLVKQALTQANAQLAFFDSQLEKAGTTGLTSLARGLTGTLSLLRSLAYILPGIGIAGIFNLAYEAIGDVVDAMIELNSQTKQLESNVYDGDRAYDLMIGTINNSIDKYKEALKLQQKQNEATYGSSTETDILGKTQEVITTRGFADDARKKAEVLKQKSQEALDDLRNNLSESKGALGFSTSEKEYYDMAGSDAEKFLSLYGDKISNSTKKLAQRYIDSNNELRKAQGESYSYDFDAKYASAELRALNRKKADEDAEKARQEADKNRKKGEEDKKAQDEKDKKALYDKNKFILEYEKEVALGRAEEYKRLGDDETQSDEVRIQSFQQMLQEQLNLYTKYTVGIIALDNQTEEEQKLTMAKLKNDLYSYISQAQQMIDGIEDKINQTNQKADKELSKFDNSQWEAIKRNAEQQAEKDKKDKENAKNQQAQNYVDSAYNMLDAAKEAIASRYDYEEERIQYLEQLKETSLNNELDAIQKSTMASKDKAAYEAQINAKMQLSKEQAEKKERKLKHDAAVADKAFSAAKVIQETAISYMAALHATPFAPVNQALAISYAILGASQLAVIAATKIPSYAEGTSYHKGGFARYGEAGAEWVKEPGKTPYLATQETISFLPTGTEIKPVYNIKSSSGAVSDWEKTYYLASVIKSESKKSQNKIVNNIVVDGEFQKYIKNIIN